MKQRMLFGSLLVLIVLGVALVNLPASVQEDPRGGLAAYEPSPAYPYGRPNPDAPPELQQFDFMVGEFNCSDRSLQQDGSWKEMKTIWNARYFMNGMAIHDMHWKDGFVTTNLRFFDPKREKWIVSWFRMPPYGQDFNWIGVQKGDGKDRKVVMEKTIKRPDGSEVKRFLTFYDITPEGYEWKLERFVDGKLPAGGPSWRITCTRRR
jgi:hypothetical protein